MRGRTTDVRPSSTMSRFEAERSSDVGVACIGQRFLNLLRGNMLVADIFLPHTISESDIHLMHCYISQPS